MIIRILNEGQYECDDETLDQLNSIDDRIESAVDAGDETAFRSALVELHRAVLEHGRALPDGFIGESDLVLPDADTTLDEMKTLLGEEGLIPD